MSANELWEHWRTLRIRQDQLWLSMTPAAQRTHAGAVTRPSQNVPPLSLLQRLASPQKPPADSSGH